MILRKVVEEAAFWDEAICLSCSSSMPDAATSECPTCGAKAYPAKEILAVIEAVVEEEA